MLSKNVNSNTVLLNWYSSMKIKLRKIPMIFDIENWLWESKFNNFLWVCWFYGKNLYDFVSPDLKLHNRYCRNNGHKIWQNFPVFCWTYLWLISDPPHMPSLFVIIKTNHGLLPAAYPLTILVSSFSASTFSSLES